MRILIINSEFPPLGGGAGNASANLAQRFAAGGQEVTVLTSGFASLPRDSEQDGYRIIRLPTLRRKADRSSALEQAIFILSGALGAVRLLRHWKPEVMLAFFGAPAGVVALLVHQIHKIPYIVSLRGGDVPGFRPYDFALYHRMIAPLLRLVWRNAADVVANSNGLRALAIHFEPNTPILVIPNGIDLQRFKPGKREWLPPRLLFVGRIVYQKGLDLLFSALGELRHLPWELWLAGDGAQREHLTNLAKRLEIAERGHFLGWQSKEGLTHLYRQANLFIFPSRHEGMPNAVLEAMASGLPVVASRIAGNEELVIPGETGLLVEPGDVTSLRNALRDLIPDAKRREEMGIQARRRVEKFYDWQSVSDQYLELMKRAMEKH